MKSQHHGLNSPSKSHHLKNAFISNIKSSSFLSEINWYTRDGNGKNRCYTQYLTTKFWYSSHTDDFYFFFTSVFELSSLDLKRSLKISITLISLSTISLKKKLQGCLSSQYVKQNFPDEQKAPYGKEIYKENTFYKLIYKFICIKV